jgi:hypothetical protein
MIYKLTSAKSIIAKVYRDFKPTMPGWEISALEWIGEASEAIGQSAGLEKKSTANEGCAGEVVIENYRAKLPCDLVNLQAVEYNGRRLPQGTDLTGFGVPNASRTTEIYSNRNVTMVTDLEAGLSASTARVIDNAIGPEQTITDYYLINPNYIITSFESGHIKLHYEAYPTDLEGFPMIPDNYYYSTAITWYVISKLFLLGYTNTVVSFQDAEQRWFNYKQLARNKAAFPSIDQMDRFRNMWVRLIPDQTFPNDFFAGGETRESIKYV